MRDLSKILGLPAALLLLISSTPVQTFSLEAEWPYNLPPHVKYFPEDEPIFRKNAEIRKRMVDQRPVGVRKMTNNEGEMFFMEYWHFERESSQITREGLSGDLKPSDTTLRGGGLGSTRQGEGAWANASLADLQLPFLLHSNRQKHASSIQGHPNRHLRALLEPRDFQCPSDTSPCLSINQPNSCCPSGETCQVITDTGLGTVGCCAGSSGCSAQVQGCQPGDTACPSSSGGGCCIAGYECSGVGCVLTSTATVVVVPTATSSVTSSTTSTTGTTSSLSATSSTADVPISSSTPPSSSSSTSASSTTTTTSPTTTSTPQPLTCSPGFQSCPVSLGGGCCTSGRACGSIECPASSTVAATTSTSVGVGAPVRPTSIGSATVTSTVIGTTCPTGFYQCSAYYNSGSCCQVGRNCGLTSCPPADPTSVLVSDGITVVVNTDAASSGIIATLANGQGQEKGTCATGWFNCASAAGGGCCPSGYACGSYCTALGTGQAPTTVQKGPISNSGISQRSLSRVLLLTAIVFIIPML